MAEDPIRIPVEAFDPEILSASLAELQRRLTDGMKKAATGAGKAAVKAATDATEKEGKARSKTAKATDEQAEILKKLEKAYYSGLKPSEKTAVLLADLHRLDLTAIKDAKARAEAELMKAGAIEQVAKKQADQKRREDANKGRSLSMLFDEQNKLLAMLPGRLGDYARGLSGLKKAGEEAAEGLGKIASNGEAGFASLGAMLGVTGAFVTIAAAMGAASLSAAADVAEATDKLDKMAKSTGISTEELSRFQQLAEKAVPGGIDKIGEGLQKLNTVQRDAKNGSAEFQKALAALGVSGGTATDMFLQAAAGAQRMGNTAERSAVLTKIFGDGLARELAPALDMGAAGISKLLVENDRYNRTLSAGTIANTAKYKDAQQELGAATEKLKMSTAGLIPILTNIYTNTAQLVEKPIPWLIEGLSFGLIPALDSWREKTVALNTALVAQAAGTAKAAEMASLLAAVNHRQTQEEKDLDAASAEFSATMTVLNAINEKNQTATERHVAELRALGKAAGKTKEEIDALVAAYEKKAARQEQAAKDEAAAAREMDKEAQRAAAQRVAWQTQALGEAEKMRAAVMEQRIAAEGEALKQAAAERDLELAEVQYAADAAVQITLDRVQKEIDAEMALKAARQDAAKAGFGAVMAWAETAAQLVERYGKSAGRAELIAFRIRKAASLAAIGMNTAVGISQALTLPPPSDAIKAVAVGLSGAAGIASVAAQKAPQVAHMGGASRSGPTLRPGEVNSRLEEGEVVVSASQARAMGGPQEVLSAIRAASSGRGAPVSPIVYDRRVISRAVRDDLNTGGQLYRQARGGQRVGLVR